MKNQHGSDLWGMNIEPRPITGALNEGRVKKHFLDMTALIRSIQRAEGHTDCFRNVQEYCRQFDCAWRQYCL
jgi:hypothetical protein